MDRIRRLRIDAAQAVRVALIGGYLLMLAANLPGHLSFDSLMSLHEGHFGLHESWNPPLFGWLLGRFDALVPGTGLYVVAASLLLFGGWLWLAQLPGRVAWVAAVLAVAMVLTPNILIYQGIVWKDVLCANTAVLGSICLAYAARDWAVMRRRLALLAAAALLFAVATTVRQNGVIALVAAAVGVAWSARGHRLRGMLGWTLGWLTIAALFAQMLSVMAAPKGGAQDIAVSQGIRIVQHYDIAGAIAHDPTLPLPQIHKVTPEGEAYLRATIPHYYSPERVDFLDQVPKIGDTFFLLDAKQMRAEWLGLIVHHPGLYLRTRFDDFRWLVFAPVIDRCLPIYLGVDGGAQQMSELHQVRRWDRNDQRLLNYTTWFMDTPVMSHLAYAVLALAVGAALIWRRRAADIPMAAMLAGGLLFAASFFVISIACDYRYLYFLDVAAITGLFYLALDPSGFRRPKA